jgi:electron transport complex protein RnfB
MDPSILNAIVSIGGMGLLFGGGLAFAYRAFYVEVDPRVEKIMEVLPGANCGACGKPGCQGFAEAVVKGEVGPSDCIPGGSSVAKAIADILGLEAEEREPMVAVARCQGSPDKAVDKFIYQGVEDCTAAQLISGGHKACAYGCLGLGSCVEVCNFDAIEMGDDRLPKVDDDKCTGCGMCVKACPRGIMDMIPKSAQVYLACVSQDKGKAVKNVCSVGCNACTLCANPKTTPSGAIRMEGNLPVVDYSIADNLLVAKHKCPTGSYIDKITHRAKFSIDTSCVGSGECAKVCPVKNCISGEPGQRHSIDQDLCIGCGRCAEVCPEKAIYVVGALGYVQADLV